MKRPEFFKIIYKLPEVIGIGVASSLISLQAPMFILAILAPDYNVTFENLWPRWAIVCVILVFLFYQHKDWDVKA